MKNNGLVIACAALASVALIGCTSVQAQQKDRGEPAAKGQPQLLKEITPEFRKQILDGIKLSQNFKKMLFTAPFECTIVDGTCTIKIQLIEVQDGTSSYCVGLVPETVTMGGTSLGNPPKKIVWQLVLPTTPVANAEFFFHNESDHGIIWLSNFGNTPQMHTGRRGDGGSGSPDPKKFSVRNRHQKTGEGVYVPIILQKDTSTGKISLCGTPDPRIVND